MGTNEDLMGAEDDVMGAVSRFAQAMARRGGGGGSRGGMPGGFGGGARASQFAGRGTPQPGRPRLPDVNVSVDTLKSWAGLDTVSWTGDDAAVKVMSVEPQDAWATKRLVFIEARSDGAAASIVSLANFFVGSSPQSPVVDKLAPIAMFQPDATDANVDLSVCYRGQSITCQLTISAAPGSGETVTVVGGMFGDWIK